MIWAIVATKYYPQYEQIMMDFPHGILMASVVILTKLYMRKVTPQHRAIIV